MRKSPIFERKLNNMNNAAVDKIISLIKPLSIEDKLEILSLLIQDLKADYAAKESKINSK